METPPFAPWRRHLLLAAGLALLLSSAAHSLLGWPQLSAALAAAGVPEDLTGALAVGWHFGGVAMVAFGAIVLLAWRRAGRGDAAGLGPVAVVAAAYLAFGTTAFLARAFNPFFLVFIAPGAALAACAWGALRRGRAGEDHGDQRPR